jgi:hypothetical protein
MGLEVKCEGDNLTDEQRAMHVVLLSAGIKVVVRKVARPVVPKVTPTD